MKILLALTFVSLLIPSAFANQVAQTSPLVAGAGFGCKLNSASTHGVDCWGTVVAAPVIPADVSHPTQISAGGLHVCVLDDAKVKCWGDNTYGQTSVPADLDKPSRVVAGKAHTCAITEKGLRCWGDNRNGQSLIPNDVKNPTAVALGNSHSCVIDDGSVRCWGRYSDGKRADDTPATFTAPVLLRAGGDQTCVLAADEEIYCWGISDAGAALIYSGRAFDDWHHRRWEFKHPQTLATSFSGTCMTDEKGLQCALRRNRDGWTVISSLYPKSEKVTDVALGNGYLCVDGTIGVKCFDFQYDRSAAL
jgi:alpha-tubulin suppressor-like RCC1 family protein